MVQMYHFQDQNWQENDPDLAPLFKLVLPPAELAKIPIGYYVINGVLMWN